MRAGHLNTLSKVLFLQMPKGRNCCWFTFCPGFDQKVFQPWWLLVESPCCSSRPKTWGKKWHYCLQGLASLLRLQYSSFVPLGTSGLCLPRAVKPKLQQVGIQSTLGFTIYFRFCTAEPDSNTFGYHNCNFWSYLPWKVCITVLVVIYENKIFTQLWDSLLSFSKRFASKGTEGFLLT